MRNEPGRRERHVPLPIVGIACMAILTGGALSGCEQGRSDAVRPDDACETMPAGEHDRLVAGEESD